MLSQPLRQGRKRHQLPRHPDIGHMHDQRIETRSALGRIDPRYRRIAGRIRRQPIDGLGRHRDDFALSDQLGSLIKSGFAKLHDAGKVHRLLIAGLPST